MRESPLSPIRSHCPENHLPNALAVKLRPCSLSRNTTCSVGAAALIAAAKSPPIGMGGNGAPVFCCTMPAMVPLRTWLRPTRTTPLARKAVPSSNASASRGLVPMGGRLECGNIFLRPGPKALSLRHLDPDAISRVILADAELDGVLHKQA